MKCILSLLITIQLLSCAKPAFKSKWTKEEAPENFVARFETSKGNFEVNVTRAYSPAAVDRFYQSLKHHFYDRCLFYRVVPSYVAQFGSCDTTAILSWVKYKVSDEKVIFSNKKGTLSFARAGKETRGNDLFINLVDNPKLDTLSYEGIPGFPAFGEVSSGMETVAAIYSGYGETSMNKLENMYINHAKFISDFPKLDSIRKAYIVKPK